MSTRPSSRYDASINVSIESQRAACTRWARARRPSARTSSATRSQFSSLRLAATFGDVVVLGRPAVHVLARVADAHVVEPGRLVLADRHEVAPHAARGAPLLLVDEPSDAGRPHLVRSDDVRGLRHDRILAAH